jgi:hypothetical protein
MNQSSSWREKKNEASQLLGPCVSKFWLIQLIIFYCTTARLERKRTLLVHYCREINNATDESSIHHTLAQNFRNNYLHRHDTCTGNHAHKSVHGRLRLQPARTRSHTRSLRRAGVQVELSCVSLHPVLLQNYTV